MKLQLYPNIFTQFLSPNTDNRKNNTANNFKIVENVFDLTRKDFDLTSILTLPEEDLNEVLKMITSLIRKNIVGFEILEYREKPYKAYAESAVFPEISSLEPYKRKLDFSV